MQKKLKTVSSLGPPPSRAPIYNLTFSVRSRMDLLRRQPSRTRPHPTSSLNRFAWLFCIVLAGDKPRQPCRS